MGGADERGVPSLRESKRELTRSRLVAAATTAFESKPYTDVTVDDISAGAGVSRATFYLYYPGKAKILRDCLADFQAGLDGLWAEFEGYDEASVASLERWLCAYVELYERHRPLLATMHQAEAVEPEFRDDVVRTVRDTMARWQGLDMVRSVIGAGEDLELRVLLFTAELQRFLFLWIIQGIDVDRDKAIHTLAEHWYTVLVGDRA